MAEYVQIASGVLDAFIAEQNDLRARLARQHEHLLAEVARRYKAEDRLAAVEALAMSASLDTAGNRQMDQYEFTANEILAAARGEEPR